jgi:GDPmannose 4,6-dehydratase
MRRALITGITGQDGSYLAEFLLGKGYEVWGLARHESWLRPNNASHLAGDLRILTGEITEGVDLASAVQESRPHEIYNLASQSRPGESWARTADTLEVNGMAAIRLFELVRNTLPACRVYHASSSEMFGPSDGQPQSEGAAFNPRNPYAAAKLYAHHMARIYRESYGLHIATGILFNHESERRPLHFVTQKIAYGAACASLRVRVSADLNEVGRPIVEDGLLRLGNLAVSRDWGYAPDFVQAMWLILQAPAPSDFVVGTGKAHSLRDLCAAAYTHVGLDWQEHVSIDAALVRPMETTCSVADPRRARDTLGWQPSTGFEEMVRRMVDAQVARLNRMDTGPQRREGKA